jgi:hypothetical protein
MIKKFIEFSINESELPSGNEIDANKEIPAQGSNGISVSTEIDPGYEVHPTISVYFPNLFMYIDLDRIDVQEYDKLSTSVAEKIGGIVQDLDSQLDYELHKCLENMQQKIKEAASKIHNIPGVTGKRYGL